MTYFYYTEVFQTLYTSCYKFNILYHDGLTWLKIFWLYFLAFVCKNTTTTTQSPFLSIFDYALTLIHPIMTLIVKVSHKRLSKIHTCHHHMTPIFKLNMLDCSALGFRVCLFGQSSSLQLLDPKGQLGIITINLVIYMTLSPPLLCTLASCCH